MEIPGDLDKSWQWVPTLTKVEEAILINIYPAGWNEMRFFARDAAHESIDQAFIARGQCWETAVFSFWQL